MKKPRLLTFSDGENHILHSLVVRYHTLAELVEQIKELAEEVTDESLMICVDPMIEFEDYEVDNMTICDRCKTEVDCFTGSMFDTSMICMDCKKKERAHPLYERARQLEGEAVKAGNYNFPGIGKPADL